MDRATFRYDTPSGDPVHDVVLTFPVLLRFIPAQSPRVDGYVDLGVGLLNLGVLVGLGIELYATSTLRIGPYVRYQSAGAVSTRTCNANGTGCYTDPPYGSFVSFGLGGTFSFPH